LKRSAAKIGIELVSKPVNTIGATLLSRCKHKLAKEQQSSVVYGISCSCSAVYVGETGRELQTRIKNHREGWEKGDLATAFGTHTACQPAFDETEILAHESHPRLRLLAESAFIRAFGERETIIPSPNDSNINRNSGLILDQRWLPLMPALR
jgi:hypothetical protein